MSLDELSERIDEDNPKTFADFIRDKDYGLSPTIPADKNTINRFRRFTGRADSMGGDQNISTTHLGVEIETVRLSG